MARKVVTPKFRVSFPQLFEPRAAAEGQEPKYSITMLFDEDADLSELKESIKEAVREKWGDKPPKNLRNPIRDQGEKEYDGYIKGRPFIRASSKLRPGVVDAQVQPILEPSEVYPGCYARASVRAFAYDVAGNRGVAFGLLNVQKLADGEPLGTRTRPEDDFEPAGDVKQAAAELATEVSTEGGDDKLPWE